MLKKLLLVLVALLLVAVGVIVYLYSQVTALPDWYEPGAAGAEGAAAPQELAASPSGWVPVKGEGDGAVELRNFHRTTPIVQGKAARAVKASRAVRTRDRIEAGVVLDTGKLPREDLSKRDSDLLARAVDNFPGLTERDVYIGVEDKLVEKGGVPQLSPEARLKVGNLTYSIADAAARLGVDETRLRGDLNRRLAKLAAEQ